MITINFFGGPGAGKSTAASGLFHIMKKHWIRAEYVQEYAKELIWSNNSHMLSEQNYIFAEQEYRLNRLREKVDVCVSDSPLLLSSFYSPKNYPDVWHQTVFEFFRTYENINIFIERSHEYELEGRVQDEVEAEYVTEEMRKFLKNNNIPFYTITASDTSANKLLYWLSQNHPTLIPNGIELKKERISKKWIKHYNPSKVWDGEKIIRANLDGIKTVG